MTIGVDNASEAAQSEQHLLHAPRCQALSSCMQVFLTRQHLSLVFVHLEHIYVL